MQRFQFPLEQVLKWRATRLELENAKLAALHQERNNARQACAALRQACREETIEFKQGSLNVTGTELGLLANYRMGVATRLKRLTALVASCDVRIRNQTAVVVERDREKRLLESLKERQFEEWKYELNREIENTAGELYLANQRRSQRA